MKIMQVKGQIVNGCFAQIEIRQKAHENIEIGDLLIAEEHDGYVILQVYDLKYESQISIQSREMMAGIKLEGYGKDLDVYEPELRNYIIAYTKAILNVRIEDKKPIPYIPKTLPSFFNTIRLITADDLKFLTKPNNPLYMGKVRSGSKIITLNVWLEGKEVLTHHLLISATTGRGKTNLMKVLLWSILSNLNIGMLVLDPHDEYYGRNCIGLKDHPEVSNNIVFYSPNPISGKMNCKSLVFNINLLQPSHLTEIETFTDAQRDALYLYYNNYREDWIQHIIEDEPLVNIHAGTLGVIRRKFRNSLSIERDASGNLNATGRIFKAGATGQSTVSDILTDLQNGKTVIIDTSLLPEKLELLIGGLICQRILSQYRRYKMKGELDNKPTISIVIEEAPRVLSSDILAKRDNIYGTIAKEGRKFKIGLIAITQLISVIPHVILANMNTKIILGNVMENERNALINSASQDLSQDHRTIASLDKGEAIITSNFTKFAIPVKFPFFDTFAKEEIAQHKKKNPNVKEEILV